MPNISLSELTFLVAAKGEGSLEERKRLFTPPCAMVGNEPTWTGLIGDVNIFVHDLQGEPFNGEIEVMIAEPAYRRRGLASEALQLMMHYGSIYSHTSRNAGLWVCVVANTRAGITRFYAKILVSTIPSLGMFEK